MSTIQQRGDTGSYVTSAALEPFRLVKLSTANPPLIGYAASTDTPNAITDERALSGKVCRVRYCNAPGTAKVTASGAIAAEVAVFAAANGKVSAAGTVKVGLSVTAAAADGDWILIQLYIPV